MMLNGTCITINIWGVVFTAMDSEHTWLRVKHRIEEEDGPRKRHRSCKDPISEVIDVIRKKYPDIPYVEGRGKTRIIRAFESKKIPRNVITDIGGILAGTAMGLNVIYRNKYLMHMDDRDRVMKHCNRIRKINIVTQYMFKETIDGDFLPLELAPWDDMAKIGAEAQRVKDFVLDQFEYEMQ